MTIGMLPLPPQAGISRGGIPACRQPGHTPGRHDVTTSHAQPGPILAHPPTRVQLGGGKVLQCRLHLSVQLREGGLHKRQAGQVGQQLRAEASNQGACSRGGKKGPWSASCQRQGGLQGAGNTAHAKGGTCVQHAAAIPLITAQPGNQ